MIHLARNLNNRRPVRLSVGLLLALCVVTPLAANAPVRQGPPPTFKAGVDRVTVTAVVHKHNGQPVTDLTRDDFSLLDNGRMRPILEFRSEPTAATLALLVDLSGSMAPARMAAGRRTAEDIVRPAGPRDRPRRAVRVRHPPARAAGVRARARGDAPAVRRAASVRRDVALRRHRGDGPPRGGRRRYPSRRRRADRRRRQRSRLTPRRTSRASPARSTCRSTSSARPAIRQGRAREQGGTRATRRRAVAQGPLGDLARWTGGEIFAA